MPWLRRCNSWKTCYHSEDVFGMEFDLILRNEGRMRVMTVPRIRVRFQNMSLLSELMASTFAYSVRTLLKTSYVRGQEYMGIV